MKKHLLTFTFVCLLLASVAVQAATQGAQTSEPHKLSVSEAVEVVKEALTKANFFNTLDYQDSDKIWVEGDYAKIDIKEGNKYLRGQDQSKLYLLRVDINAPNPAEKGVTFKVSAKNQSILGKQYEATVIAKFEAEFNKRLNGFDKLRTAAPTAVAEGYLNGENLTADYGYTTLKIVGLGYTEPHTWENYQKTLAFLAKECPTDTACENLGQSLTKRDEFWALLGEASKKDPSVLLDIENWVKEDSPEYAQYVTLLNASAESVESTMENLSLTHFENVDLPQDWKAKGVGSERARALERMLAFRSYDFYKRTNAFDVDTQEVLMVRRIAQKLFPYALRKGLDYKVHIYDDTKPSTGFKNNAFTSGGGILYFSRSLIQRLDPQDEAAIAAVVSHEMGHNEAYHIQRQVMRAEIGAAVVQLSSIGDLFVPGVSNLTSLTNYLVQKSCSRSDEYEADRLGLYLLYKAGYEPEAMERVMETIYKMSGDRYTSLSASHPAAPARRKRVHYLIMNREALAKTTPANAGDSLGND